MEGSLELNCLKSTIKTKKEMIFECWGKVLLSYQGGRLSFNVRRQNESIFWLKLILVSVFVSPPDQIKFNLFLLFLFFLDVMVSLDLGIRVEVFYLNTIEQLFLFIEQLDQLEVCLPYMLYICYMQYMFMYADF